MKKSLSELASSSDSESPKPKSFGAFTNIEGNEATIDLSKLQDKNIFFATPCYGGMLTDQYFLSMFRATQLLMKSGINFRITTLRNESLISRARNILTAMFLDSDCTHLMFIDADIEFQAESLLRALAYDKDVIAGAYPKKALDKEDIVKGGLGAQYAINFKFTDAERKQVRVEHGLAEVLDASTGFFMVKRETIEKMIGSYPELHYRNDSNIDPKLNKHCYNLWDVRLDPKDNRLLSEDYSFCRRWQELGGEIWLDLNTRLNHVGSYTFEGDISKIIG